MSKLQSIKQGSELIDQIFWELFQLLKVQKNLTELDLARLIKRRGKHMAFPPIVSFGPNSAEIHHKPNKTRFVKNNFLMLDYGVKINGYCSDFTRTLFLGRPNKLQDIVYNTVLKAQLSALREVKIGKDCAEVDLTARNLIAKAGFAKNYNHHTGHAVGKLIHELPGFTAGSPAILTKDLVMTVEPGIYLPGKFGVRIEDMVLIANKPKIFSKVPKDLKSMIVS